MFWCYAIKYIPLWYSYIFGVSSAFTFYVIAFFILNTIGIWNETGTFDTLFSTRVFHLSIS